MAKIPFSNEHHIINLAQAGQGPLFFLYFEKNWTNQPIFRAEWFGTRLGEGGNEEERREGGVRSVAICSAPFIWISESASVEEIFSGYTEDCQ